MAYKVVPDRQGVINIGKIKENLVTEVELPAPGFGGGSYAVLLRRPKEEQPYPVTARYEGGSLVWTVQTADTAIAALQAQLATATQQLAETQAAVVDTTAMTVDYIYEQDSKIFGGDDDDNETDTEPVDVPGV